MLRRLMQITTMLKLGTKLIDCHRTASTFQHVSYCIISCAPCRAVCNQHSRILHASYEDSARRSTCILSCISILQSDNVLYTSVYQNGARGGLPYLPAWLSFSRCTMYGSRSSMTSMTALVHVFYELRSATSYVQDLSWIRLIYGTILYFIFIILTRSVTLSRVID